MLPPGYNRGMATLLQIAQLGHPVLRDPTAPVADPTDPSVISLGQDMIATLIESGGVGIAAPQVYRSLRLIVVASRPTPRYPDAPSMEPTVMANPEIVWSSDRLEKGWEGCLSIPGIRGHVPRAFAVGIRYLDTAGKIVETEFSSFAARVFQHEFDHLEGTVFFDRLESPQDIVTEKEYMRLISG